jgi:hypothetical protein
MKPVEAEKVRYVASDTKTVTHPHTPIPTGVRGQLLKNVVDSQIQTHFKGKFGPTVAPIALLKTLAVISAGFKENVKLWVINVAPSRHLKSQTSLEQEKIFRKSKLAYTGSDFTIHSIAREYNSGRDLNGKCLQINDLTLLLASKASRTKSRLIDALSELASEGKYVYGDFQHQVVIQARFSLTANITPQSYERNWRDLLANTFIERCLVVFHELPDEEMSKACLELDKRKAMKPIRFTTQLTEKDVKVTKKDLVRLRSYAKQWRIWGGYSSISQVFVMAKSVVVAYAILAGHNKIGETEYRFLNTLGPYLQNPHKRVRAKILELAKQERSVNEICEAVGKDYETYKAYVYRVLKEPSKFNAP